MNEISCGVCMDLIPLVRDGVAGEESTEAVVRHIASCEACASLYREEAAPPVDMKKSFDRFRRRLQLTITMLMMFGIFFGLSLTMSGELFYNSVIMPLIGGLGYFLFRWKAVFNVPLLLLITHFCTNLLGAIRSVEHLDLYSLLLWTAIYSLLAVLGTLAAGLLCYLRRSHHEQSE